MTREKQKRLYKCWNCKKPIYYGDECVDYDSGSDDISIKEFHKVCYEASVKAEMFTELKETKKLLDAYREFVQDILMRDRTNKFMRKYKVLFEEMQELSKIKEKGK